ncbi:MULTISPECIES: hypothetical protein [unclassified Kitasatospora]|uniref:deoxynucleotide monophosphate kinase family protein n=1 Tax=unclassified Kitasatospora TaxID=2633591 RepID=UPI002475DF18|nr:MULTISPECIES: hypothetical protein [unclassified Kitasatospora]MDH6123852.1 hypothetical protein [Kitasatospora sp. GP82]MDH6576049.1 hypothetical protein [Kitasatospora sp. MAP5-34]
MHIAFIGRARSGKDSAAARLVDQCGYARVAFADPLKEAALKLDPIVYTYVSHDGHEATEERLSEVVGYSGWERAKAEVPEVRRVLQHMGQGVRDLDPEFWIRQAVARIESAPGPVVVTDCRYRNEAAALKRLGFRIIRVQRPPHGGELTGPQHVSETELDDYQADATLFNFGSLQDLWDRVDLL